MNYTLKQKENFDKLGLTVHLYEHKKTKAQVVYAESDDRNKTFGVGFKTPPSNSKGMAHIMEHSVLNGSKKYRTREPFMDMASSSLQTFLNAMTYPDKTVYPVSSENDKDFFNLTDVYLDAVFNPRVVGKKEILDQEGWHYDLDENDKVTGVSGVVYNEMKGALTSSDELVYSDFISKLYKDSPYQYESGGDPAEIYKITFPEFQDFYYDHYHPSNAYIYFYGDLDIDFYLDYLDKEYLSHYDYKEIDLDLSVPDNSYDEIIESTYPTSKVEEDCDYLIYGKLLRENMGMKDYLTTLILISALFNMDSSKIRNQITEEIDPEYFYARAGYGNRKSLIIQAQKADGQKIDRFVEIIEEGLSSAAEGINKESLRAAFSIFEYNQREQLVSVMRGLSYFLMWDLVNPIFDVFNIIKYLDQLKELIETDYYENFIKENFIENPNKLVYLSRPDQDYVAKQKSDFDAYIEEVNKKMSPEDLATTKADLEKLQIHQNKEDTEEEKATIPVLNIEDVAADLGKTPRLVEEDGFNYIYHDLHTAGLIYSSLYFDIDQLDLEEIQYLAIINELLGSVDTRNISYKEIDDILWQNLSSPSFNLNFININDKDVRRFEKLSFTTTLATADKALDLMKDFALNSLFDNQKRVIELLRIKKSSFESNMYDSGHMIAINRANAHIDKSLMLKEATSGIDSYLFTKKLIDLAKNDYESLKEKLESVYQKIFTKALTVNITASEADYKAMKGLINEAFGDLAEKAPSVDISFSPQPIKEAILSDANVNYVAKTADIKNFGHDFDGSLMVTASILSNPYLYELIRAKGGAYGAGLSASKLGLISAYSYRDPNITETLDVFDQISELAANVKLSDRDFENQQISSMGSILRQKSPSTLGEEDFINYLKDDPKDPSETLAEIKNAKIADIHGFAGLFETAMATDNICVFGNRDHLNEINDKFDKIIDLND